MRRKFSSLRCSFCFKSHSGSTGNLSSESDEGHLGSVLNRVSRNVENLKDAPDVDMLIAQISAFIPNERMKEKFLGKKISFPVLEAMNSVF